jgi:glycerol-3-phosphate dehydrogenase
MWSNGYRDGVWSAFGAEPWDLLIIGGGITGAGIAAEAARYGKRALLVEAQDFSCTGACATCGRGSFS